MAFGRASAGTSFGSGCDREAEGFFCAFVVVKAHLGIDRLVGQKRSILLDMCLLLKSVCYCWYNSSEHSISVLLLR